MAANGDVANKIGTFQLAVAARHMGIPFYVAAPSSTCDPSLASGRLIPIEERPGTELTQLGGVLLAEPGGCQAWGGSGVPWGGPERPRAQHGHCGRLVCGVWGSLGVRGFPDGSGGPVGGGALWGSPPLLTPCAPSSCRGRRVEPVL